MPEDYNNINGNNKDTGAYGSDKQNPSWAQKWQPKNIQKYKDSVYDKISELLLKNWSKIEPYSDGKGLKGLQKTYRNGSIVTGRRDSDMMVVYESDVEANADDEKIEGALLNWLEFADVSQLTLKIVEIIEVNDGEIKSPPNLILELPDDRPEFNLNEVMGTLDLKDINLTDNVSQFLKVNEQLTQIDRSKLTDHVDTEFSELTPITFTNHLEQYNKLKNKIPFRQRSESFFKEYKDSSLPTEYRIEKFFEEFERMKLKIKTGNLAPFNDTYPTLDELTDDELYGWETLTYLVAEAQKIIGTNNAIYSQEDVITWLDKIQTQAERIIYLEGLLDTNGVDISALENLFDNLELAATDSYSAPSDDSVITGCTDPTATNYNSNAQIDDYTCLYTDGVPGCMISTAINYDVVKNPTYDFCKSPDDFVSETPCSTHQTCVDSHGAGWTCDGSCQYAIEEASGCTVPTAWNFNPNAIEDDGTCGCFGTQPYRSAPHPYYQACQPGPESAGTQNMTSCTCDYPNIDVTWSRKSSDCYDYNWGGYEAKCKCTCKSDKPTLVADKSWDNLGDCAVAFENDDTNCESKCNTKCGEQSTSVSGKPVCASDETWNGVFCEKTARAGGIVKRSRPKPTMKAGGAIPVSKAISYGPSSTTYQDIRIPNTNLEFDNKPIQKKHNIMEAGGTVQSRKKSLQKKVKDRIVTDRYEKSKIGNVNNQCIDERNFLLNLNPNGDLRQLLQQLENWVKYNKPCLKTKKPKTIQKFPHGGTVDSFWADTQNCPPGHCGDANGDGIINVLDVVAMIDTAIGNAPYHACQDMTGDGSVNVMDVIAVVNKIICDDDEIECTYDTVGTCPGGEFITGCDGNPYMPNPVGSGVQGIPLDGRYNAFGECGNHNLYFSNGTQVDTLSCGGSQGMCAWFGESINIDPYDESNFGDDPCITSGPCYQADVVVDGQVVLGGQQDGCIFSYEDGCRRKGGIV